MRVMFHPPTLGAAGNPYVDHLARGLSSAGVELVPYTRRGMLARLDAIHVNWPAYLLDWRDRPHAILDVGRLTAYLTIARLRGTKIVWTAHDLGAHDRTMPRLRRLYERVFSACVTDVISLSAAGVPALRRHFPELRRARVHVVPHGHYRDDYPHDVDRAEARARLGIPGDGPVVLQFGQLRRYKGIDAMIRSFAALDDPDAHLVVVGESKDETYTRELQALAGSVPRVDLRASRVSEEDVGLLLTACDVLYAAYPPGTSLNSGVAVLGVSFARRTVVRDTPVMRELASIVGDGWIVLAADGQDSAALRTALDPSSTPTRSPALEELDWGRIVAATLAVYRGSADAHSA